MEAGPPFKILSTCRGGGYRYCRTDPPHPHRNAKGLYPLHRVLLENKLGRLLKRWGEEVAHHADEDKSNDDPANIVLKAGSEHSREHQSSTMVECKCPVCGTCFQLKAHVFRLRAKRGSGVTCSRSCGGKLGNTSRSRAAERSRAS